LKISFIKCLSSDPYKFQKNDQLCTRENYVLLLLFFEGKKGPRASCVYIHTALVSEDTALRLEMPLSCYYQKTQNGFCLSYYMTSCTLLEEPSHPAKQQSIGRAVEPSGEHNIMPLQSVSKWLFFYNTKMSEISSPFF